MGVRTVKRVTGRLKTHPPQLQPALKGQGEFRQGILSSPGWGRRKGLHAPTMDRVT